MSTEPRQHVTIDSFTRPSSPVSTLHGKQVDYKSQVTQELWHKNHIETVTDVALYCDFYHLQLLLLLVLLHPFNGLFSRTTCHQKRKPFWILLE